MTDAAPTLAIVGAGPGLGASIARVFGSHGYRVALVARNPERLEALTQDLVEAGVDAAGFTADVLDRPSLATAFEQVRSRFGQVDVLEYSPAPHSPTPGLGFAEPLDLTVENVQPQIEYYLYGAIAAAGQVLPSMLERGRGTLLFTTGGGSVSPIPMLANVNVAAAALRNWVLNLHGVLAEKGVYAAHVPISAWIGSGAPEAEADTIAQTYWDLHSQPQGAELHYTAL